MRAAYLKMHLAIFLWGFTGLLGKLITLNEGMLVWYRMLISTIAVAFIILYRKTWVKLPARELAYIMFIGVLVMLHWVTFYGSIKLSSISVAMICLSSIAVFASIIEPIVNRTKFDYTEIVFALLAATGIITIYNSDVTASAGIIVGVISAFISATFAVLNRRIASKYNTLSITVLELGSGWLVLSLLLPVYFMIQPTEKLIPDGSDFFYLMLLSLVCTVLTWILSLQALRKVSAYTMALALNLEPVYGIILAVLFAGEGRLMQGGFLAGAMIILGTVVAHTFYRRRKALAGQAME